MIAFIDSSVLLRLALQQKNQLKEFKNVTRGVASRLIKSECLRTIDRLLVMQQLRQEQFLAASEYLFEIFEHLEIIPVSDFILERVGEPLRLNLGTLDAIHLFSAVLWKWQEKHAPFFLTHDVALAKAAQTFGFKTIGT